MPQPFLLLVDVAANLRLFILGEGVGVEDVLEQGVVILLRREELAMPPGFVGLQHHPVGGAKAYGGGCGFETEANHRVIQRMYLEDGLIGEDFELDERVLAVEGGHVEATLLPRRVLNLVVDDVPGEPVERGVNNPLLWCAVAEVFLFQVCEFLNRLVNVDVVCEVHGVTPFTYRNNSQRDGIGPMAKCCLLRTQKNPRQHWEIVDAGLVCSFIWIYWGIRIS